MWLAAWFASWAGHFDDAVRYEAEALNRDPSDAYIPASMANHYVELGDLERANEWLAVAERSAPNDAYTRHARVWLLWWRGEEDNAGREARDFFDLGFQRSKAAEDMTDFVREVLVEYRLRRGEPQQAVTTILNGAPPAHVIERSTDPELIMKHLLLLPAWRETDPGTATRVASELRALIEPDWRGPLHRWDTAVARCGLAAFEGRLEDALSRCDQQYRLGARWTYHWWQISSLFAPIRREPQWQAYLAEIRMDRAEQLARLRASGDEPMPGAADPTLAASE
jgi:hypothetical protein